jgi:hypothetical protein
MIHHPHNILRYLKNDSLSKGLLRMSARCSYVEIYLILISPELLKDVCALLLK